MATAPITFYRERLRLAAMSQSNDRITAATQSTDRKRVTMLDRDTHRSISPLGRRTLLTLGRHLYENAGVVRGAVSEMATYSASTFVPQYYGRNKAWGSVAEDWLYENDRFIDLRGWPHSMTTIRRNLVKDVIVDGDCGILLTEGMDGSPKVQVIPSHRIGSPTTGTVVQGGPYDGATIIDGVILNDYGAAIAYRLLREDGYTVERDVPARDFILCFIPEHADQVRGFSHLGAAVFDFQDVAEFRRWEMIAQKVAASLSMIETNESGEADEATTWVKAASDTSATAAAMHHETIDGGTVRYFRAGAGSKLEIPSANRPTANQQEFHERVLRAALHGIGWSYDFSLDPTRAGGAQMRVVVEKINRRLSALRSLLLEPVMRRIDGWRVSKAVNLGLLPEDVDWHKWDYQGPGDITADKRYDSDVSIQEIRAGITTPQREIAKRGAYWEDVMDDSIAFEKRLQERCAEAGVSPDRIILLTPNGNSVVSAPTADDEVKPQPAIKEEEE